MDILIFAVAVGISALDPLLMVAYGTAGALAPNWRWALALGPLAGAILLIALVLIRGEGWHPKAFNVAAQLVACGLCSALVRLAIDTVRSKRAAPL